MRSDQCGVGTALPAARHERHVGTRAWMLFVLAGLPFFVLLPFVLDWPKPYLGASAGATVWLLAIAMGVARRPSVQNALVFIASVSFCLTASELVAWYLNASGTQMTGTLQFVGDPDLGYGLRPNQRAQARETYRGSILFDVTYTIDADGFRAVSTPTPSAECRVAFFGDSFTFGWGLADGETLPDQFVAASGGLYRGYNFAHSGYGPHQMLRMLETGRVDRVVGDDSVNLVIYQGIVDHVARVVGRNTWDLHGPQYVLAADSRSVEYVGPFRSDGRAAFVRQLQKSEIYIFLTERFSNDRPRAEDVPLYIAILKQTQREVERRYGTGSFVILFWYDKDVLGADPAEQFKEAGLNVISVERIIPDIDKNGDAYRLAAVDSHPNVAANRRIAEFLAHEIGPQHCQPRDRSKNAARQ